MAEKMNLRPSERRLLVVVGLVVFVVINIWFVWPQFGELQKEKNARAAALDELTKFQKEIALAGARKAQVEKLKAAGADVPREEQVTEMLRTIQRQADAHKMHPNYGKQTSRTNQFFLEQSMNITTLSGEEELVNFLYNLGSGNSTIRVRDLDLRTDPRRYQLSANIQLVCNYQLKSTAARKQAAPGPTAQNSK